MSKEIATLYRDAPFTLDLEAMDVTDLDTLKLKTLLTKLEFRTLLRNLPSHMQNSEVVASAESELAEIVPANVKEWDESASVAYQNISRS